MRPIDWGTALLVTLAVGCNDNSTSAEGSGGSVATGGAHTGGVTTTTSRPVATGGATATSASKGGAPAATGGSRVNGSTPVTSTGGNAAGGASSPTGGRATGGNGVGGTNAGGQATGGQSVTSGTNLGGQASGGTSASAGTNAGGQATGGKPASAGTNAGGQATGGKSATSAATAGGPSTGGTSPTGGQANGGGTSAAGAPQSSGCGKAPTIASSQYNNGTLISITAASMQRRFILNVPTNYDNTHPYRLVIAYHQLDGNDKQMYANSYYHLLNLSNNSTIFVAPNGQKNGAPCSGTGNGESGCGWPNSSNSDLQLADAIVAQLEENFCIDKSRIFATGWSYGGSMSYKTACERPQGGTASWFVRGIAVYSGSQLSGTCTPSKPVAYYASHGSSDSVLCYEQGSANCQVGNGLELFKNFASANGCTYATPTKVTSGNHVCSTLAGCATGYPTEFCSFNGDHTPDPKDPGQSSSWEYQNAWNFISQF